MSVGGILLDVAAGQLNCQLRSTVAAVPRVSLQLSVAVCSTAVRVQLGAKLCAVVVLPTKLKLTLATANPLPTMLHWLKLVVAALPLPAPPAGLTLTVALALAPKADELPIKFKFAAGE